MNKNQSITLVFALAACLSACSPRVDSGGYVQETPLKDQITIGQTTRDDIQSKFGSPSAQSSFGSFTWYYITDRKEAVAFWKPKVVEQDVTRIEFDNSGTVTSVETFNKGDARDIALVSRTTPTEGHTLGFVEQLVGNIGRFNHAGTDPIAPGRRPSSSGGL